MRDDFRFAILGVKRCNERLQTGRRAARDDGNSYRYAMLTSQNTLVSRRLRSAGNRRNVNISTSGRISQPLTATAKVEFSDHTGVAAGQIPPASAF